MRDGTPTADVVADLIYDIREVGIVTESQARAIAEVAQENLRHVGPYDLDEFIERAGIE